MLYDESLDEIPEEFADAYSFKSANKRWGSVISNGEEIFVNCEKRYIDTEYTVKHIRDGKEVSEDTASFKSRCWAGENTRTVTLTKEALQPRTYNGYEYFKILPENAAAGNTLEDHAEIQLWYRKDSDAEKTVFYAVTYYKDGEECDSVIQRKRIWSGAADRLEIKSGALGAERYDGYLLDHVEPDVKEGEEISSGSLIDVYYVKNSSKLDNFVIEDTTLVEYKGAEKHVIIPEGIERIDLGVFAGYKELEFIEFPESLKSIGTVAFADCSSLIMVKFPEGLRSIGTGAFEDCCALSSIEFPESLHYIGAKAFGHCTALKGTLHISQSTLVIENAFEGNDILNIVRDKPDIECTWEKRTRLEDQNPCNKKNIEIVTMSKPDPYSKRPQYTVKHIIIDEFGQAFCHSERTYAMIDWSGEMGNQIPIQKDSLKRQNISGYVFYQMISSHESPEEGELVPSGTVIKLCYKKVKKSYAARKLGQKNDKRESVKEHIDVKARNVDEIAEFFAMFDESAKKKEKNE